MLHVAGENLIATGVFMINLYRRFFVDTEYLNISIIEEKHAKPVLWLNHTCTSIIFIYLKPTFIAQFTCFIYSFLNKNNLSIIILNIILLIYN